jgi:hypothetical protein
VLLSYGIPFQGIEMHQDFQYHKNTQIAVKSVLDKLPKYIDASASEKSIAFAVKNLLALERQKFEWFHDIHISVSSGQDTKRSKNSKYFKPGNDKIGSSNLINVDLKSIDNSCVGDCSRSYVIENANVVSEPETVFMAEGMNIAHLVHDEMKEFISDTTQFHELFLFTEELLASKNFENLVSNNNFGHSISLTGDSRHYLEKGNFSKLSEIDFFSYNIHVCKQNSMWGFRFENIYFINEYGNLEEL